MIKKESEDPGPERGQSVAPGGQSHAQEAQVCIRKNIEKCLEFFKCLIMRSNFKNDF